jgi:hypothetical protein
MNKALTPCETFSKWHVWTSWYIVKNAHINIISSYTCAIYTKATRQYTKIVTLINKIDSMVAPLGEKKNQSSGLYLTGEDQAGWVNQQFNRETLQNQQFYKNSKSNIIYKASFLFFFFGGGGGLLHPIFFL